MTTVSDRPMHAARIDIGAISHNVRTIRGRTAGDVMAALTADGYGHGLVETARAALDGGAMCLAVSALCDVATLRAAGIDAPVVASQRADPQEFSNSMVRIDCDLYGLGSDAEAEGLRPAMRVTALVIATKTIDAGDGVSYGYTYRAVRRTNLALVALGYADGLDRSASNRGALWLGGRMRAIAGRVAMNVVVLELGDDRTVVGEEAVLFGDSALGEPTAGDWAASIGQPVAGVVSTVGALLPRYY